MKNYKNTKADVPSRDLANYSTRITLNWKTNTLLTSYHGKIFFWKTSRYNKIICVNKLFVSWSFPKNDRIDFSTKLRNVEKNLYVRGSCQLFWLASIIPCKAKPTAFVKQHCLQLDWEIVWELVAPAKVLCPISDRFVVNVSYKQLVDITLLVVQLATVSLNRVEFLCAATRSSRNGGSVALTGLWASNVSLPPV